MIKGCWVFTTVRNKMKELDEIKTIAFERWLINNYPEREDNTEYACVECDGDGMVETTATEYGDCISCGGTGSTMYSEYKKRCESDQKCLRKFLA